MCRISRIAASASMAKRNVRPTNEPPVSSPRWKQKGGVQCSRNWLAWSLAITSHKSGCSAASRSPTLPMAVRTRSTVALSSVSGSEKNCGACGTSAPPRTPFISSPPCASDRHHQRIVYEQRIIDAMPLAQQQAPAGLGKAVEIGSRLMDRGLFVDERLQHKIIGLSRDDAVGHAGDAHVGHVVAQVARREHLGL